MFGGGESHRVWQGIAGLLLVVIGVVLIRHLHLTVALVGLIIGLSWIVEGVAALISAFAAAPARDAAGGSLRDPHPDRRYVITAWPVESVTAIAVLIGIWFIILGLFEIVSSIMLRRAESKYAPPWVNPRPLPPETAHGYGSPGAGGDTQAQSR